MRMRISEQTHHRIVIQGDENKAFPHPTRPPYTVQSVVPAKFACGGSSQQLVSKLYRVPLISIIARQEAWVRDGVVSGLSPRIDEDACQAVASRRVALRHEKSSFMPSLYNVTGPKRDPFTWTITYFHISRALAPMPIIRLALQS